MTDQTAYPDLLYFHSHKIIKQKILTTTIKKKQKGNLNNLSNSNQIKRI